jgi:hypothetical protein
MQDRRRWLVVGLVASGCGSVASMQVDALPSPDSETSRCNPTAPFGAPVPLTNLNSPGNDAGAWLTADELTLYFASDRSGGVGSFDIYVATRTSIDAVFSSPNLVPVSTRRELKSMRR